MEKSRNPVTESLVIILVCELGWKLWIWKAIDMRDDVKETFGLIWYIEGESMVGAFYLREWWDQGQKEGWQKVTLTCVWPWDFRLIRFQRLWLPHTSLPNTLSPEGGMLLWISYTPWGQHTWGLEDGAFAGRSREVGKKHLVSLVFSMYTFLVFSFACARSWNVWSRAPLGLIIPQLPWMSFWLGQGARSMERYLRGHTCSHFHASLYFLFWRENSKMFLSGT